LRKIAPLLYAKGKEWGMGPDNREEVKFSTGEANQLKEPNCLLVHTMQSSKKTLH
jgi:hypothetical protein